MMFGVSPSTGTFSTWRAAETSARALIDLPRPLRSSRPREPDRKPGRGVGAIPAAERHRHGRAGSSDEPRPEHDRRPEAAQSSRVAVGAERLPATRRCGGPRKGNLARRSPWGSVQSLWKPSTSGEGCTYFDRGPDQGFPSGPVRLVRNPETVPMSANGSLVRSGKTWGPVSPDNVGKTGDSLGAESHVSFPGAARREDATCSNKVSWSRGQCEFLCPYAYIWVTPV
jgi:hypothetical protein